MQSVHVGCASTCHLQSLLAEIDRMHKETSTNECPESERFLSGDDAIYGYKIEFTRGECIKNFHWGECSGSCEQEFLDYSEYYLLQEYALTDGFEEFSQEETTKLKGEITSTKKVIQGFFVDENRTRAIISDVANESLIPEKILDQIQELTHVEHLYEGYEYLLAKANDKIFTFSIQLYNSILEIIRLIDLHLGCKVKNYMTNTEGTILILETEQTKFLISGILATETEETERAILTSKLEAAKPFFEFKPVQKVDWSKLKGRKGDTFEKLVESLLPLESNIIEVNPVGKTNAGDRGRDFLVIERSVNALGGSPTKKWLVQCKFSEKSISTKSIPDWVTRTIEHGVDGYWLITNNDLTPDLFDQLSDVPRNENYKFETRFWQRNTFDIKLTTRPELFKVGLYFDK